MGDINEEQRGSLENHQTPPEEIVENPSLFFSFVLLTTSLFHPLLAKAKKTLSHYKYHVSLLPLTLRSNQSFSSRHIACVSYTSVQL